MQRMSLLLFAVLLWPHTLHGQNVDLTALDKKLQGMFGARFGEGFGDNIDAIVALELHSHLSFEIQRNRYYPTATPNLPVAVDGLSVVDVRTAEAGAKSLEFRLLFIKAELAQVQWFTERKRLSSHFSRFLGKPTSVGLLDTWSGKSYTLQVRSDVAFGDNPISDAAKAVDHECPSATLTNVEIARKVKPLVEAAELKRSRDEEARRQKELDILIGRKQVR